MTGEVLAVCANGTHSFSKPSQAQIRLLEGLGVEGDAHMGATVKHRSLVARNPSQPNLRQVHLMHGELLDELRAKGFEVTAGGMGENIVTRGLPLLDLARGTRLRLGPEAVIEVTGLRHPCKQLNGYQSGLMKALLDKDDDGNIVRKSGVMAIVLTGGPVKPGDIIEVEAPEGPHRPLEPV